MTTTPPPAVPIHKSPLPALNISIIEPTYNYHNTTMNAQVKRRISYLGKKPRKYTSLVESDLSSSSDESEIESNRFSSESYDSKCSEEHQFWQVHASTTIIAPPMSVKDYSVEMSYQPKNKRVALATQVRNVLGSTFEMVDNEIEKEWENSRTQLKDSLIVLPTLSL
ncbi:hypothetical protein BDF21DRAFT_425013 [Thamnidium elegans]|uniref:Uncharacterized protein n=1 Tax=Thamnidium elegans TaxID=101142 RepID=A0A8H7W1B3_9FUNG|nr:hypothetical protein INT48_001366 [Thamnidium elegans]KAI8070119.1 hypothetical protein BDF21DRAFT_425013 [Thamnidium elegans]